MARDSCSTTCCTGWLARPLCVIICSGVAGQEARQMSSCRAVDAAQMRA